MSEDKKYRMNFKLCDSELLSNTWTFLTSGRRLPSQEEINKRLSLPADLKLPENFVEKQAVSPTLEGPLSRATRRQSLSEIGFGRMDTYTKLDKLGEVTL